MNRIENTAAVKEAAKYFQEEVLENSGDIPRQSLCDMVDNYIYYQADISRQEARSVVQETCLKTQHRP